MSLTFTSDPSRYSTDLAEIDTLLSSGDILFDTVSLENITLSGLQDINGKTGADGVRVLVNGQSDQAQNGGYIMRAGAWQRVTDNMFKGVFCVIRDGDAQTKDTIYLQSRPDGAPDGSSSAWFRRVDSRYVHVSSIDGSFFVETFLAVLDASNGRSALGATTVGSNLFTATNPDAERWIRVNSDNTISFRSAAETLSDIGAAVAGTYLLASNNLSDVSSAATSRSNLGLGTIATQNANSVAITGGSVTGLNALSVTDASDSQMSVGVNNSASMTAINSGQITLVTSSGNFNFTTTGGSYLFDNASSAGRVYLTFTGASSGTNVLDISKNNGGNFVLLEYLKPGSASTTNDEVVINTRITSSDGSNSGTLKYQTTTSGSSQSGAWQFGTTQTGAGKVVARLRAGEFRLFAEATTNYVDIKAANTAVYSLTLPTVGPAQNSTIALTAADGTQSWSVLRNTVTAFDLANVVAGGYIDVTLTVVGATTSQCAYVNRVGGFGDLIVCHCRVSAADQVTVRLYNPTGSDINLAAADIIVGLL